MFRSYFDAETVEARTNLEAKTVPIRSYKPKPYTPNPKLCVSSSFAPDTFPGEMRALRSHVGPAGRALCLQGVLYVYVLCNVSLDRKNPNSRETEQ